MSLTQFTSITGTCVPVPGPDMDTDRIIPARFLKCITFDELAGVMFWDERFDENGQSKSHPVDRKSTRLNSSHMSESRMPSSA